MQLMAVGRGIHLPSVRALVAAAVLLTSPAAVAEPTSAPLMIKTIRPYAGGQNVYVHVGDTSFCAASTFVIDVSAPNGKEMYAAALTAFATKSPVRLEAANDTGCAGWGTKLQSLFLDS